MSTGRTLLRLQFPSKLLFLPGASGDTFFWRPLADRLWHSAASVFVGYPGLGQTRADTRVKVFDDLVTLVVNEIDQPVALIAQSMGGVIAVEAALKRTAMVTHLVLAATSGGIDTRALGAEDWRVPFARENPGLPDWFLSYEKDLTPHFPKLSMPTLLIWGDSDPISPLTVGQHLLELLPNATLHVVPGGNHDSASLFVEQIAPVVDAFLKS